MHDLSTAVKIPSAAAPPAETRHQPSGVTTRRRFAPLDERQRWRPVSRDFAVFVENHASCPACRLARQTGAVGSARRFHVIRSGDLLAVTDADDLHDPGGTIFARHIMDTDGHALFRMLGEPPRNAGSVRFRPAAGVLIMSYRNGRRQFQAIGIADGFAAHHDYILDAIETYD